MRAIFLSILGLPVDLPTVTKGLIRLTQARSALAELSGRNGEYSWAMTLPATRDNARIFGVSALHSLGLDKFRTVDFPFELRCDGEIFTGIFRLTSMRNGYTGNLIGSAYSWANEIGDKKLTDLKLGKVTYNGAQLESFFELDCDSSDIQFPLLSFGNFYAPPRLIQQPDGSEEEQSLPAQALIDYPLSVDDYAPSVYYRNVLRQIFADIGWSLTGRVLDESRWRETLIAPAGADLAQAWPWGALLPAEATATGATCYSYLAAGPGDGYENNAVGFAEDAPCGNIDGLDLGGEVFYLPVGVPQIISGGTRAMDGATATYIGPVDGVYGFAYSAELQNGHQTYRYPWATGSTAQLNRFLDVKLALLIRRGGESFTGEPLNGQPVDTLVVPHFAQLSGAFDASGNVIPQTLTGAASGVFLQAGDSVQLCVIARRRLVNLGNGRVLMERAEFVVNFGAVRFACTSFDGPTQLSPAAFLPPLSQRDVIRDFMLRTDTVALADANRRTVSLLTRDELAAAAGERLDLTQLIDPQLIEYTPAAGASVGAVVFGSAKNPDEPLPTGLADEVRITLGPGTTEQRIDSLFAPVAMRSYVIPQPGVGPARAALPTMSTADTLAQPLAEVSIDIGSQAPRLLRFVGVDATVSVPFQTRRVGLARAEWAGALRFDGPTGAVESYYLRTVARLRRGHVGKVPLSITPALYRQLTPGRGVTIAGAEYSVETVSGFDIADESADTTLELIREL